MWKAPVESNNATAPPLPLTLLLMKEQLASCTVAPVATIAAPLLMALDPSKKVGSSVSKVGKQTLYLQRVKVMPIIAKAPLCNSKPAPSFSQSIIVFAEPFIEWTLKLPPDKRIFLLPAPVYVPSIRVMSTCPVPFTALTAA